MLGYSTAIWDNDVIKDELMIPAADWNLQLYKVHDISNGNLRISLQCSLQ